MPNTSHVDMYDPAKTAEENVAIAVLRLCDLVNRSNMKLNEIALAVDQLKHAVNNSAPKK